jgi:hypothetical protein
MDSKPQNSNFTQNSSNFDYISEIYVDHIHEYNCTVGISTKIIVLVLRIHMVGQCVHVLACTISYQQWSTEQRSV